jgi:hypothetical protein
LTNHQDRFLQALLPWMAACVAALCVRIWQLGAAPRLALAALVGLQLVWGSDFYFSPNHVLIRESMILRFAKHLRRGMEGQYASRFKHYTDFDAVNAAVPRDAVVLLHNGDFRLGLERRAVSDQYGYQGALDYRGLNTARAIWTAWHNLGVTHVLWPRSEGKGGDVDQRARERAFREAVKHATRNRMNVSSSFLAELTPEPPP